MDNEQLLSILSAKIASGEIKSETVAQIINYIPNGNVAAVHSSAEKSHLSITKILYTLGASVAILGIIFFIAQIWNDIGSVGRITATLILGLLLTFLGTVLTKSKPESKLGDIFHIMGGVLIPSGAIVTLGEILTPRQDQMWPFTITFGIIFAFYLLLNFTQKSAVLTFFTIANGTTFIYLLTEALITGPVYDHGDIYAYLTMVMGICYLLLAYSFKNGWNKNLISILNFFGSAGFLGAAFTRVFDSGMWQLLFFGLAIGGLALSVKIKSKEILAVSTIFLIIHFAYITGKYFADSIGWPISLIILGFLFIGLGYMSININKKYITGIAG